MIPPERLAGILAEIDLSDFPGRIALGIVRVDEPVAGCRLALSVGFDSRPRRGDNNEVVVEGRFSSLTILPSKGWGSEEEALRFVFEATRKHILHELSECFYHRERRMFDPHAFGPIYVGKRVA